MSPKEDFQQITAIGAVKEGFKEGIGSLADGLKAVAGKLFEGVKEAGERLGPHGAAELGAALFNGSAYVMYQKGSHDQAKPSIEVEQPEITQSRGMHL